MEVARAFRSSPIRSWLSVASRGHRLDPSRPHRARVLQRAQEQLDDHGGPDNALWFTEPERNLIGRIPTSATVASPQITEYPAPTAGSQPARITLGPDHQTLYFTEQNNAAIGKITTSGATGETSVSGNAFGITSDPDGKLWVTFPSASTIGSLTPF